MKLSPAQTKTVLKLIDERLRSEYLIQRDYGYLFGRSREPQLASLRQLKADLEKASQKRGIFQACADWIQIAREFHEYAACRHGG